MKFSNHSRIKELMSFLIMLNIRRTKIKRLPEVFAKFPSNFHYIFGVYLIR